MPAITSIQLEDLINTKRQGKKKNWKVTQVSNYSHSKITGYEKYSKISKHWLLELTRV